MVFLFRTKLWNFKKNQQYSHLKPLDTVGTACVTLDWFKCSERIYQSMNCTGFNFVEWPCVFLTSNISGRQLTKENPEIFPKGLSGLCFSVRLLWKNIETTRCHCKHCRDFFTNRRRGRNVSKAKQLSEQYCKLLLAKFEC